MRKKQGHLKALEQRIDEDNARIDEEETQRMLVSAQERVFEGTCAKESGRMIDELTSQLRGISNDYDKYIAEYAQKSKVKSRFEELRTTRDEVEARIKALQKHQAELEER